MTFAKDRAGQCPTSVLSQYGEGVHAWDRQIRLFAKYFLRHARLPRREFSLLDVGCGTGSALSEIHRSYPAARLSGCDLETEHVEISKALNGDIAMFFRCDLAQLQRTADIIYASNVLEHLPNWDDVTTNLLARCHRLYVMVPYRETINGEPVRPDMGRAHLNYFAEHSFDFLKTNYTSVAWRVLRTPHAWGHPWMREFRLKTLTRFRRTPFDQQRQLLVGITNADGARLDKLLDERPFFSVASAWVRTLGS